MKIDDTNLKFQYKEVSPPGEISHLVFCFFEFLVKDDSPVPIPHEVFPDTSVAILYRRNERLDLNLLLVKGLSLETFHTKVFSGDVHWGVKFSPAASAKILRCDPKDVITQPVLSKEILPHLTFGLLNKLKNCKSFEDLITIFENTLKSLKIRKSEIDEKVSEAIKTIEESKGEAKISKVAEAINLSRRQLERRFRKNSGLTLKQFARICRFRATAINLIEDDMNWTNRAAELGFADQAHLTHELSSLTGRSPKSFEKKIKDFDYDEIIK